jgi:hypothetical protein
MKVEEKKSVHIELNNSDVDLMKTILDKTIKEIEKIGFKSSTYSKEEIEFIEKLKENIK